MGGGRQNGELLSSCSYNPQVCYDGFNGIANWFRGIGRGGWSGGRNPKARGRRYRR
jgi:hypothetical protein